MTPQEYAYVQQIVRAYNHVSNVAKDYLAFNHHCKEANEKLSAKYDDLLARHKALKAKDSANRKKLYELNKGTGIYNGAGTIEAKHDPSKTFYYQVAQEVKDPATFQTTTGSPYNAKVSNVVGQVYVTTTNDEESLWKLNPKTEFLGMVYYDKHNNPIRYISANNQKDEPTRSRFDNENWGDQYGI